MGQVLFDHSCRRCHLYTGARTVCVAGEGEPGGVFLAGENPGANEDREGRPFIGEAGNYVRPILKQLDPRMPLYISNVIKCVTKRDEDKTPSIEPCRTYIEAEIRRIRPKVILAVGSTAVASLTGAPLPITTVQGAVGTYVDPETSERTPVVMAFHPAAVLRNRGLHPAFMSTAKAAYKIARGAKQRFPIPWDEVTVHTATSKSESTDIVREAIRSGSYSLDSETNGKLHDRNLRVLCYGISWDENKAFIIPEEYANIVSVQKMLRRAQASRHVEKIMYNAPYDIPVVAGWNHPNHVARNVYDPMLAFRLVRPLQEVRIGLENTSWFVNMGGYYENHWKPIHEATKREHKCDDHDAFKLAPRDELHVYCGRDAISALRQRILFGPVVEKIPAWKRFYVPAVPEAAAISMQGIPIDVDRLDRVGTYLELEIEKSKTLIATNKAVRRYERLTQRSLEEAAAANPTKSGRPRKVKEFSFNPASPKQMGEILFGPRHLGGTEHDVVRENKTGPSTDDGVLTDMLASNDTSDTIKDLIQAVQRSREVSKLDGTYVHNIRSAIRPHDLRLHPALNPGRAITSRWTAGGYVNEKFNIQTIPTRSEDGRRIKAIFCAPPGYKLVIVDLSQVEIRVAAAISKDPKMIAAINAGEDFHRRTGSEVQSLYQSRRVSLDEVTDDQRRDAKATIFGLIYGEADKALAASLGISQAEAARLRAAVLGVYRKLASWIDSSFRTALASGEVWIPWDGKPCMRRLVPEVSSADRSARGQAARVIVNTPIQGWAALFTTATIIKMSRWLRKKNLKSRIVLTVHDDIVYLCPDNEAMRVARMGKKVATSWPCAGVPLGAEVKIGSNLAEAEKVSV